MQIGINYPWINCGWDFGVPPLAWIGGESVKEWQIRKRQHTQRDFEAFARQGIFAVRWFLLSDGMNYGMEALAPRKVGRDWSFNPLPEGDRFYDALYTDFEFVLQVCRNTNLKLLPSLIDFGWCSPGIAIADKAGIVKGGRYDILRDSAKRKSFLDRVLDPLLASSLKWPDSIYAWELINEPEWVIRRFWNLGLFRQKRTLFLREMKDFIAEGMGRINAIKLPNGTSAFLSSVGFAHWESIEKWDAEKLGITLPQFHYYAQRNRGLPHALQCSKRPCLIGEFATASGKEWPELKAQNRDQSITQRLSCIEEKGYPACFMWSARAVDGATRWTEEAHREVFAFNMQKANNSWTSIA